MRLLPGWLAGQPEGAWTSMAIVHRRRPVDRVANPLREMGADVSARDDRLPPLEIRGASPRGSSTRCPWRARR